MILTSTLVRALLDSRTDRGIVHLLAIIMVFVLGILLILFLSGIIGVKINL